MKLSAMVSVDNAPGEVWERVADFENLILTSPSIKEARVLGGDGHLRKSTSWSERSLLGGTVEDETCWVFDIDEGHFCELQSYRSGLDVRRKIEIDRIDGQTQITLTVNVSADTLHSLIGLAQCYLHKSTLVDEINSDLQHMKAKLSSL